MRRVWPWAMFLAAASSAAALPMAACGGDDDGASGVDGGGGGDGGPATPAWLVAPRILVPGVGVTNEDCRADICPHNENTDLIVFRDAIYLVHRTAISQILGPNSALHVYRSDDGGATFSPLAVILAPEDRDLRDPHFYEVGGDLYIKALTRLPVVSTRDSFVDTVSVGTFSSDRGAHWSPLQPIGPATWSFWRIRERDGVYYNAAYQDGDKSVKLFSSTDGLAWTPGALIYDVAEDTPLETELTFMPSGKLLALVRMDGTNDELLGNGRLRTKICWADPPYDAFSCPDEFEGQRLDGPLTFFAGDRLLVLARKHLADGNRKRTALFEITGTLDGGPLAIQELGELPSAGDTAYAGAAATAGGFVISWYSSNIPDDAPWARAILDPADIWVATIDVDQLP